MVHVLMNHVLMTCQNPPPQELDHATGAPALTSGWGKAGDRSSRASATLMAHQEAISSPAWRASCTSLQSTHCSTRVRACRSPVSDQRKRHSRLRSAPVRLLRSAGLQAALLVQSCESE